MELTLDAALVTTDDDGLQELVVLALLIPLLDSLDRVVALLALAEDHALQGNLIALPPLIAVHRVVPTDNGGDLTDADLLDRGQQLLHVAGAGLGVRVAAITEEVDEDLGDSVRLGGLEQGIQVRLLRVLWDGQQLALGEYAGRDTTNHAAVRHQAAEVKTPVAVLRRLHDLLDNLVVAELALFDGLVDTDDVLPDDTAGANVQMTDFGVAHQALRKTDSQRGGFELGETGGALGEMVHDGGLGGGNGVAILGRLVRGDAPAVNHD